jgi:ATP-dependent Clp protease protease subunit
VSAPGPQQEKQPYYILTGGITPEVVSQAILWIHGQVWNGAQKIRFILSSVGGDIDSSIRLHDYLSSLPIEVETVGFGQVDSAAILIFLAGTRRKAIRSCRFRLHEGLYTVGLQTASIGTYEETMRYLQELLRRTIDIIATLTGKKREEIQHTLREGKILTTEQAKDFGIIHEILEEIPV